jgi:hypothetical protein
VQRTSSSEPTSCQSKARPRVCLSIVMWRMVRLGGCRGRDEERWRGTEYLLLHLDRGRTTVFQETVHSRQGTASAFDALGSLVNDPCLQAMEPRGWYEGTLPRLHSYPASPSFHTPSHPTPPSRFLFIASPCLSSYGRRFFMAPSLVGSCQVDMAPRPKTQSRNASVVRDPRPGSFSCYVHCRLAFFPVPTAYLP